MANRGLPPWKHILNQFDSIGNYEEIDKYSINLHDGVDGGRLHIVQVVLSLNKI